MYVVRESGEAETLGHNLSLPSPPHVKGKYRNDQPPGQWDIQPGKKPFVMNPFHQHYNLTIIRHSPAWLRALAGVSPLPQPTLAVTYFSPTMVDRRPARIPDVTRQTEPLSPPACSHLPVLHFEAV